MARCAICDEALDHGAKVLESFVTKWITATCRCDEASDAQISTDKVVTKTRLNFRQRPQQFQLGTPSRRQESNQGAPRSGARRMASNRRLSRHYQRPTSIVEIRARIRHLAARRQ